MRPGHLLPPALPHDRCPRAVARASRRAALLPRPTSVVARHRHRLRRAGAHRLRALPLAVGGRRGARRRPAAAHGVGPAARRCGRPHAAAHLRRRRRRRARRRVPRNRARGRPHRDAAARRPRGRGHRRLQPGDPRRAAAPGRREACGRGNVALQRRLDAGQDARAARRGGRAPRGRRRARARRQRRHVPGLRAAASDRRPRAGGAPGRAPPAEAGDAAQPDGTIRPRLVPGFVVIAAASSGAALFAGMANVAEPQFVVDGLDGATSGYSLMVGLYGLGIAGGALAGSSGGGVPRLWARYLVGVAAMGCGYAAAALAPVFLLCLPGFVLAGAGNGLLMVHERLLLQSIVPEAALGRAFGTLDMIASWAFAAALAVGEPSVAGRGSSGALLLTGLGTIVVWLGATLGSSARRPVAEASG